MGLKLLKKVYNENKMNKSKIDNIINSTYKFMKNNNIEDKRAYNSLEIIDDEFSLSVDKNRNYEEK